LYHLTGSHAAAPNPSLFIDLVAARWSCSGSKRRVRGVRADTERQRTVLGYLTVYVRHLRRWRCVREHTVHMYTNKTVPGLTTDPQSHSGIEHGAR
jgi:hypothetical protein